MPKSLADGHRKFTLLTTAPANPLLPTATELNAGIDASCQVLASDFSWGATDSDSVSEAALCEDANSATPGRSNWQAGVTFFRYFDTADKQAEVSEETGYQAAKAKGTTLYGYLRENGKKQAETWAADDEATFIEVVTDRPQNMDGTGFIKRRVPMLTQRGADVVVAAGS